MGRLGLVYSAFMSATPERKPTSQRPKTQRRFNRRDLFVLALIVAGALVLRLVNLENFPDNFNPDEADNFQDVMQILYGAPIENGFFGFDWKPQPAFSVYMLSGFVSVLGTTVTAMRLPSAIISCLALVPFYLLLRRQFSTVAAALSTLLLAGNLWYLNFSRSAWENVHIAFYMLSAMLFLMLALDRVKAGPRQWRVWLYFAISGFFCALGLYGYFGGRAIVLAVAAYFPIALWFYRQQWRTLLAGFALTGAVATLLFMPQLLFILQKWEFFNYRSKTVFLLSSPEFAANPLGTLWSQVSRNALGPWLGSVNQTPRYTPLGEPQLDMVTGALVLNGIFFSLLLAKNRRRPETWLWWVMLLVSWTLTQVLTVQTPDGARGVGWMPALFFFAACMIEGLVVLVGVLPWRPLQGVAVAGLAIGALLVGYGNVTHYVEWQDSPDTRFYRQPSVETDRFAYFAAEVKQRMQANVIRVRWDEWQEIKPLRPNNPGFGKPPAHRTELHRWDLNVEPGEPLGIAYLNGNIYMADFRGQSFAVLDTVTGAYKAVEATNEQGRVAYAHPGDVAVGPDNLLYLLNNGPGDQALLVMREDGWVVRQVALGSKTDVAIGIHVTQDGSIFVADKAGGRVLKYGPQGGEPLMTFRPPRGFNNVSGVLVDASGVIYAADTDNHMVHEFDPGGRLVRSIDVECPAMYLASNGGWLEVSCPRQVMSINEGEGYAVRTRAAGGSPLLVSPTGLDYGPDGTLYVREGKHLLACRIEH
ncbi:MAG: glycosyltransferase family 39 protein [Chloroflexota bacterium]|nr:glycosyltransferase family 39 protein [Chloroflexota bacterium]MDQ5865359.1 glycosyltransferase family 39 protein [Chloroflexota bacterium]